MMRCFLLMLFMTSCDDGDSELERHKKTFNNTYFIPSPWQEVKPNFELPEETKHIRSVPIRK